MVTVPADRAEDPVRAFSSFTGDLHALRDWLLECRIRTVAIENTGNYWVAIYQILEDAGLEVFLVRARHVKGVPGRKTDVCDAAWRSFATAAARPRAPRWRRRRKATTGRNTSSC